MKFLKSVPSDFFLITMIFAFFTQSEDVLTLHGFAYPLERRRITCYDLYTVSNQLIGETGTFINEKNPVLLIRSRDEKKDS